MNVGINTVISTLKNSPYR
ncbi:hypothetical protein HGQ66_26355 [Serratia marcescens]|nr:hypothetical protein [Serratia marcescens]